MELVIFASTGIAAAASLAAGVGIGYFTVSATTAALERLFATSGRSADVVAFPARAVHGQKEARKAA